MSLRCLPVLLCLAAPLLAQDAPKPAAPAEKPAPKLQWQWQAPSREVMARFAKLSEAAKARLQSEFASNSEALQALSVKEYNARFEKAFRAAVQEDEAKGLSNVGVPSEIFTARDLTYARVGTFNKEAPSPELVARFQNLSAEGKEKIRAFFRESREKASKMTDEERRTFFEANYTRIAEEDEDSRK